MASVSCWGWGYLHHRPAHRTGRLKPTQRHYTAPGRPVAGPKTLPSLELRNCELFTPCPCGTSKAARSFSRVPWFFAASSAWTGIAWRRVLEQLRAPGPEDGSLRPSRAAGKHSVCGLRSAPSSPVQQQPLQWLLLPQLWPSPAPLQLARLAPSHLSAADKSLPPMRQVHQPAFTFALDLLQISCNF